MIAAALLVAASLGAVTYDARTGERIPTAAIESDAEPVRRIAGNPRLIPGYPPRQLIRGWYDGQRTAVWGWYDTEGRICWFASENPHVKVATPSQPVANYGVNVRQVGTMGGTLQSNDDAFAKSWLNAKPAAKAAGMAARAAHKPHPIEAPCPGPGPCPLKPKNPSPPPDPPAVPEPAAGRPKYLLPGLLAVAGVLVLGFLHHRKGR